MKIDDDYELLDALVLDALEGSKENVTRLRLLLRKRLQTLHEVVEAAEERRGTCEGGCLGPDGNILPPPAELCADCRLAAALGRLEARYTTIS